MEHINLPVSVERTGFMTDLIDAKGNTIFWERGSFPEMDEIALALNEHDKLVAERDALVKACEAFISKVDERQGDMFQEDGDRLDWLNDIFYYEIYDFRAAIKGEGSGNDEHAKRDVLIGVLESIDLVTEQLGETVAGGVFKGGFLGVRAQVVAALALVRGEEER